jgi:hypothetical protein
MFESSIDGGYKFIPSVVYRQQNRERYASYARRLRRCT